MNNEAITTITEPTPQSYNGGCASNPATAAGCYVQAERCDSKLSGTKPCPAYASTFDLNGDPVCGDCAKAMREGDCPTLTARWF